MSENSNDLTKNISDRLKKWFSDKAFIKLITKIIFWLVVFWILRNIFTPLLPNADEYQGKFPEQFWENVSLWLTFYLWRRIVLFHEYYTTGMILELLSGFFLLLLVHNIRKITDKIEQSEELIESYLLWGVGSLLVTIVFLTRSIDIDNIQIIGTGMLFLIAVITVLLVLYRFGKKRYF
jgi:preprotein translocase subunit SecG